LDAAKPVAQEVAPLVDSTLDVLVRFNQRAGELGDCWTAHLDQHKIGNPCSGDFEMIKSLVPELEAGLAAWDPYM
jgi:hypothetical protein